MNLKYSDWYSALVCNKCSKVQDFLYPSPVCSECGSGNVKLKAVKEKYYEKRNWLLLGMKEKHVVEYETKEIEE